MTDVLNQFMPKLMRTMSALMALMVCSCQTLLTVQPVKPANVPFMKNAPTECYFLDDFMPIPDSMVVGRSSGLGVRYYTYNMANYKDYEKLKIILAFYSRDDKCWSLFEETIAPE